jgi:hypothetical protein
MINPYRRHSNGCRFADRGVRHTKCNCSIWGVGTLNGKPFRKSMGTRDWSRAVRRIDRLENGTAAAEGDPIGKDALVIGKAFESYFGDCRRRKLADSTIISYHVTLDFFEAFCKK